MTRHLRFPLDGKWKELCGLIPSILGLAVHTSLRWFLVGIILEHPSLSYSLPEASFEEFLVHEVCLPSEGCSGWANRWRGLFDCWRAVFPPLPGYHSSQSFFLSRKLKLKTNEACHSPLVSEYLESPVPKIRRNVLFLFESLDHFH